MTPHPHCLPLPQRRRSLPGALLLSLALLFTSGCIPFLLAAGEGDGHAEKRRWEQAEAAYLRALSFQQSPEVQQKLRQVREQWSSELVQQAKEAQAGGDTATTRRLLVEARARNPSNAEAAALLAPILDAEVAQALAAFEQGHLASARDQLRAVLAADPLHTAAREGLERVLVALAKAWFARGREFESQGLPGSALLSYLLAEQERAGATPAAEQAQAVRGRLCEELTFWVVPKALRDDAGAPDVAQRLGAERLVPLLPRAPLLRAATTLPSSPRPGVAVSLLLQGVLPQEVVEATTRGQRYVAGERDVPNPRYAERQRALRQAEEGERRLEGQLAEARQEYRDVQARRDSSQSALDKCLAEASNACERARADCSEESEAVDGEKRDERSCEKKVAERCDRDPCKSKRQALEAQEAALQRVEGRLHSLREDVERQRERVSRAQRALDAEPPTVMEPVYDTFYYEVRLHRRRVLVSLALMAEDLGRPDTSPAWYTEQHVAEDEDETHDSYPRYGVSGDPLVLRSDWQLRQEAADRALAAVAAQVGRLYESWRTQQADLARREWRQPSGAGREYTVRALLVYTGQPPQDLAQWLTTTQGLANTGPLRCP